MNHFYQLNLAAPLQTRVIVIRTWIYVVCGVLIGLAILGAVWVCGEHRRETAAERLAKMNMYAMRVCDVRDRWARAAEAYRPIEPLVARQCQRSVAEFLPVAEVLASPRRGEGPTLPPPSLGYRPVSLAIERDSSLALMFWLPFPPYDRQAYRDAAYAYFTNVAFSAAAAVAPGANISLSWDPERISADLDGATGKLVFDFSSSSAKSLGIKAVPKDLNKAIDLVKKWNGRVGATVLADGKTLSKVLDTNMESFSEVVPGLGDLKGRFTDPLHVIGLIREATSVTNSTLSMPKSLEGAEAQWRKVAGARWPWSRSKVLDVTELDNDSSYLQEVAGLCPKPGRFDEIIAKSEEFYNSVTGGVGRANIEQDRSFEEKILVPAFSRALPPAASLKMLGSLAISTAAKRVDFPDWTVAAEFDPAGATVSFAELAEAMRKVEANPTGIWAAGITVEFEEAMPERGWPRVRRVQVAGRVPCHL